MTDQTTNPKILTSTLSDSMAIYYDDFAETFGIGPCGAYCALKREQGWGQIAVALATVPGNSHPFIPSYPFPHFVIMQDGVIIDLTNPHGETLIYTEIELLDPDEMPDLVNQDMIDWLKERRI